MSNENSSAYLELRWGAPSPLAPTAIGDGDGDFVGDDSGDPINISTVRPFSAPFTEGDFNIYQFGVGDVDAGDLLLAFGGGGESGIPTVPVFSGGDYTWTFRNSGVEPNLTISVYTAPVLSTPTGSETVHIAPSLDPGYWFIHRLKNVDISDPVVQTIADTIAMVEDTPVNISLAPLDDPSNSGLFLSPPSYLYWSVDSPYTNFGERLVALGQGEETITGTVILTFDMGTDDAPVIGLELRHV